MRQVLSHSGDGIWSSHAWSALLHGGIIAVVVGGFVSPAPPAPDLPMAPLAMVELVVAELPAPPPVPISEPAPPSPPRQTASPAVSTAASVSHALSRPAPQSAPPVLRHKAVPNPAHVSAHADDSSHDVAVLSVSETAAVPAVPSSDRKTAAVDQAAVLRSYGQQLWQQIMQYRPRRSYLPGTVHVRFRLDRSGQVLELATERSSGHGGLDQAAEMAVRRAAPFPAPPENCAEEELIFVIPFSTGFNDGAGML